MKPRKWRPNRPTQKMIRASLAAQAPLETMVQGATELRVVDGKCVVVKKEEQK